MVLPLLAPDFPFIPLPLLRCLILLSIIACISGIIPPLDPLVTLSPSTPIFLNLVRHLPNGVVGSAGRCCGQAAILPSVSLSPLVFSRPCVRHCLTASACALCLSDPVDLSLTISLQCSLTRSFLLESSPHFIVLIPVPPCRVPARPHTFPLNGSQTEPTHPRVLYSRPETRGRQ